MAYEAEIAGLVAKADALRGLQDDDPNKEELTGFVDEINALRAKQNTVDFPVATGGVDVDDDPPRTRKVIEDEANSLGLVFDKRTTDKVLEERIALELAK
jgi:hypothetical protein